MRPRGRFPIPALAPCSLNFTGIVLPRLKIELPSGLMGCKNSDPSVGAWTWTQTLNEALAGLPAESAVVQVTGLWPSGNVDPETGTHSTGTGPSKSSTAAGAV